MDYRYIENLTTFMILVSGVSRKSIYSVFAFVGCSGKTANGYRARYRVTDSNSKARQLSNY